MAYTSWFYTGSGSTWIAEIRLSSGTLYRLNGVSQADLDAQVITTENRWNSLKVPLGP